MPRRTNQKRILKKGSASASGSLLTKPLLHKNPNENARGNKIYFIVSNF